MFRIRRDCAYESCVRANDGVEELFGDGFALVAHSDACPNMAICDEARGFYGIQCHPEVDHTQNGTAMIRNFLYEVCGAKGDWTMGDYKEIIEPLRMLFKDEVWQLGRELGLLEYLVMRQPFPGPGLSIRVIGDITKEKLDTLQQADLIFQDEIAKAYFD